MHWRFCPLFARLAHIVFFRPQHDIGNLPAAIMEPCPVDGVMLEGIIEFEDSIKARYFVYTSPESWSIRPWMMTVFVAIKPKHEERRMQLAADLSRRPMPSIATSNKLILNGKVRE
jgi:hypothetical protein